MPWNEVNRMSLRHEFVVLSQKEGANIAELCRRFRISRKTGYKWIKRYKEGGVKTLNDRSKKPQTCPHQIQPEIETAILLLRKKKPTWGGRKLRKRLQESGHPHVPAASTITAVLRRGNALDERECNNHKPHIRFQKETPNELWQMDFKGDFPTLNERCYPLSVLDDCTRFVPGLYSCGDQKRATVQECLEHVFQRYGLPHAMLMDNGPPWGGCETCVYTRLTVWLIRLGIEVLHGRPYHPQTQGKVERFHRTLKTELLCRQSFVNLTHCQQQLDRWREEYNYERPHEALDLATPGSRYHPSTLPYPEKLPPVEYAAGMAVRKVQQGGKISFQGKEYRVGWGFRGECVALQESGTDGVYSVYFCRQKIKTVDIRQKVQGCISEQSTAKYK